MIGVSHEIIEGIPCLHVVKGEAYANCLPTIFFLHGITSRKEVNLHYAYFFAEKGFRVLLPDARMHGERHRGETEAQIQAGFWDTVLATIDELKFLKDDLANRNLIDLDHIGVAGTSMGGIATLGALTQYSWIHTAVSMMGSPAYVRFFTGLVEYMRQKGSIASEQDEYIASMLEKLKAYDLSLQPEKLGSRPLLFWHSEVDNVVPFNLTYSFYESIQSIYKDVPDHLHFIVDHHAGHKVPPSAVLAAAEWFTKHLWKGGEVR